MLSARYLAYLACILSFSGGAGCAEVGSPETTADPAPVTAYDSSVPPDAATGWDASTPSSGYDASQLPPYDGSLPSLPDGGTPPGSDASVGEQPVEVPGESDDCMTAPDHDNDGLRGSCDNCRRHANAGQEDSDKDGKGDACDACDNVANPACTIPVLLPLPAGDISWTIGVVYEIDPAKSALYDKLNWPLCTPERRLAAIRMYSYTETPFAGQFAKESWFDLKASQYGKEGWLNEGIYIPEEYRGFYATTQLLGGWKKQYTSNTVWKETDSGWTAKVMVGEDLLFGLEFMRRPLPAGIPGYMKYYLESPPDMVKIPEPQYILNPADFDPKTYETVNPLVYDSAWPPSGTVEEQIERGIVRVTWGVPTIPAGEPADLRWMELLPKSGTEFPGYFIHKIPSQAARSQTWLHLPTGYGECSQPR